MIEIPELQLDDRGFPVLLEGPSIVLPGVRSGNPWRTPEGEFGNGPPGVEVRGDSEVLSNLTNESKRYVTKRAKALRADGISGIESDDGKVKVMLFRGRKAVGTLFLPGRDASASSEAQDAVEPDVGELPRDRRRDAVVDASRQIKSLDSDDIEAFARRRSNRDLSAEEVTAFVSDVRRARLDDLVDSLDDRLARKSSGRGATKKRVSMDVPRTWLTETFRGLTDDEVSRVIDRLRTKGWQSADVKRHIVDEFATERKSRVQTKIPLDQELF